MVKFDIDETRDSILIFERKDTPSYIISEGKCICTTSLCGSDKQNPTFNSRFENQFNISTFKQTTVQKISIFT